MKCAESLADGLRERDEKIATAAWKNSYLKTVIGTNGPEGKLRGVLLTLWDLSDPMGRTWHSLHSISKQSKTKKRTLQRLLDDLEQDGWITKTPMTWAQLAVEQAKLGFRLPDRHDDANAPVLILLTYKGKAAFEEMKLRVATNSHNGHDPRPKRIHGPMAKVAHDPGNSVLDVHKQEVRDPKDRQPLPISLNEQLESGELQGWGALLHSYDLHYRRVYNARPTSAVPMWLAKPLGGHVADLAVVLRARLHEKKVAISLEESISRIADKAMGTWLDSKGSDGKFLRKVAHRMSELQNDLPRQARHAVDAILSEMSPKPEPRSVKVVPFTPRNTSLKTDERSLGSGKPEDCADTPNDKQHAVLPPNSTKGQTIGELDQVKPKNCTEATLFNAASFSPQISTIRQTVGKLDRVKPTDCTDAPEPSTLAVLSQFPVERQTTGKLDQVKHQGCTDAPESNVPVVSPQMQAMRQTAGKLNAENQPDRTDAPKHLVSEARKLLDRLGQPSWCDEKLALEMLHAQSADVVVATVSRLRIDEKSMTRSKISAMIFIALYALETRNDNDNHG